MRKTPRGIAIVIALLCIPAIASAQRWDSMSERTIILLLNLGVATPHGVEDAGVLGLNLGGGLGYKLTPTLALIGHADYSAFLLDRTAIADRNRDIWDGVRTTLSSNGDLPVRLLSLSADIQYRFNDVPEEASAYVAGGALMLMTTRAPIEISGTRGSRTLPETRSTVYGATAAFGIDYPLVDDLLAAFFELRLGVGLTGGVSASHIEYNIGIDLNLPEY